MIGVGAVLLITARDPISVYKDVLRGVSPTGVTNIQVAGHGMLMGHSVWLKCSATDAAINAVLDNNRLAMSGPNNSIAGVEKRDLDDDARSISWERAFQIKHVEDYGYEPASNIQGGGWAGEIVIDRANHIVYVRATGPT